MREDEKSSYNLTIEGYEKINHVNEFQFISEEAKEFIQKCFSFDFMNNDQTNDFNILKKLNFISNPVKKIISQSCLNKLMERSARPTVFNIIMD